MSKNLQGKQKPQPGTANASRQSERPTSADPNAAADHEEIDLDLEVADNNSKVAGPPVDEDDESYYDEQEGEESEDSNEYHDSNSEPQNQPQAAAAKGQTAKTADPQQEQKPKISAREQQLQEAKAAEEQRLKTQQLKQKALKDASIRQQQQQKQAQLESQKSQQFSRMQSNKTLDQSNKRLIGAQEEDERFSIPGRDSNQGLMKGKVVSPDRPQNAAFDALASMPSGGNSAPSFKQFRAAGEFFDLTFKFQTLLDSLSEIFRMTSLLEGLLFFVAMIFFFIGEDKSVWYLVLALFHVARSFVGFAMGRLVPSSYDFVEKLEFKGEKPLVYENVRVEMQNKVQKLLLEYYEDYEKPAKLYTLLALVSSVLDVISFFAVFGLLAGFVSDYEDGNATDASSDAANANAGGLNDEQQALFDQLSGGGGGSFLRRLSDAEDYYLTAANPYLGRIIVVMLYTMCDLLFVFWIMHFRSRIGESERIYVHKALLGFGDSMRIAFGANPKGGRPSAPGQNTQQRSNDLAKNRQGGRGGRQRD